MPSKYARPYQVQDLAFLIKKKRGGLLHDPGGGKTLPACLLMYHLATIGYKSYFVMPKSLLRKNYNELLECTNFKEEEIVIIDGSPKAREAQMKRKTAKVFLMGFSRFGEDWKTLKKIHPDLNCIVIDEYHMGFKSVESERTNQLIDACKTIEYFIPLSGTIIAGRLDSCYSAIHIIEPRYYVNLKDFQRQHGLYNEYGTIVGWTNYEKIGRIMAKHFRRLSFKEIYGDGDINSPAIFTELCSMHPKQREAYKKFEKDAVLELDNLILKGEIACVAVMRCRQIMANPHQLGILKSSELSGKEESLLVHIADHINTKEPTLIYATLQPEQERVLEVCKKAGLKAALINGNVSTKKREQIDADFRSGKINCLVASPATAAVGFNWGHVNHIIFMSLNYENVDFVQAYRRAIRGTRTTKLRVTVFEYEKSIDQRIFQIVNDKSKGLSAVDSSYEKLKIGGKLDKQDHMT